MNGRYGYNQDIPPGEKKKNEKIEQTEESRRREQVRLKLVELEYERECCEIAAADFEVMEWTTSSDY